MIYEFNNIKYCLEHDDGKIFNYDLVKDLITDYFVPYDYIFCDMAYGKLRLKGFCDKSNKKFKDINDFSKLDDYIKNYCANGCKWFYLKKIK